MATNTLTHTPKKADAFRDALIARGLTGSSMTRVFDTVRSVVNFAASEQALSINNPFAGVYCDRSAGASGRNPVLRESLKRIQTECRVLDDELRWLVAMVSDTGTCLAEAAGMRRDDIVAHDEGGLFARIWVEQAQPRHLAHTIRFGLDCWAIPIRVQCRFSRTDNQPPD